MASIVILHDPNDTDAASKLASALRSEKVNANIVLSPMRGGGAVESGADVYIAVWSKSAVDNEAMLNAAGEALAAGRLHSVRIDEKRAPAMFGTNAGADLSNWTGGRDANLDALIAAISPAAASAALPPALADGGAPPPDTNEPVMRVRVRNQPRGAEVEHGDGARAVPPVEQAARDEDKIIVAAAPPAAKRKDDRRKGLIAGGALVGLAACLVAGFLAFGPRGGATPETAGDDSVELAETEAPLPEAEIVEEPVATDEAMELASVTPVPRNAAPLRGRADALPPPSGATGAPQTGVVETPPARLMTYAERDSIAYAEALEQDTIAAYSAYLNQFPEGFHAVDARSRREQHFVALTDAQIAQLPRGTRTQVERARRTASRANTAALSARLIDGAVSARDPTERLVVVMLPDGARYEGQWESGEAFGVGRGFGGDGGVYAGSWQRSRRNGFGVLIYPSGVRYEGEFIDDTPTGRGVFWDAQGRLMSDSSLFTALLRR